MIRSVAGAFLFMLVLCGNATAQTCVLPNTLTNGTNADANQVMANFNALVTCLANSTNISTLQPAGRLSYQAGTQLIFAPRNGNQIKINGTLSAIPSGGIAGCTNASAFVNGTANQNLVASTLYYVYAFVNSGTVTCDFSTMVHATSSTAGNVGTEIKSGDDTRSLVGMVYTNSSAQFVDSSTQRFVRSWFNEAGVAGSNFVSTATPISFISPGELTSAVRVNLLLWASENFSATVASSATNNTAGNFDYLNLGVDGTGGGGAVVYCSFPNASYYQAMSQTVGATISSEGLHYLTAVGQVSGGLGTYASINVSVQTTRR